MLYLIQSNWFLNTESIPTLQPLTLGHMLLTHPLCKFSWIQDSAQAKEKKWIVKGDLVSGANPLGIMSAWQAITHNMTLHHLKNCLRPLKLTICPLKDTAEFGGWKFLQVQHELCSTDANWLGFPNNCSGQTIWRSGTESKQCTAPPSHFSHQKKCGPLLPPVPILEQAALDCCYSLQRHESRFNQYCQML